MKKYFFLIGISILFSSKAFAAGYGDAGCGLGSLLFHDQPGITQVLAATTNGTSYNQPFGITSGTSNCDAKGIVLAQKQQESFVQNNFSGLAKEMATGEGEQLAALAGLMGCPTAQQPRFNTAAQQNYQAIFTSDSTTPAEVLTAVRGVVSGDSELSTTCTN
jgi:Protein of unknown function (DUF3015)